MLDAANADLAVEIDALGHLFDDRIGAFEALKGAIRQSVQCSARALLYWVPKLQRVEKPNMANDFVPIPLDPVAIPGRT